MFLKLYDRIVAEGKTFLVFAILFAIVIRLIYYISSPNTVTLLSGSGYLWFPLEPIFSITVYSLLASSVMVALIAGAVNHVNTKHAYIRRRTLLPPAVAILLFSCMPSAFIMSSGYIAALIMVMITNMIFKAYNWSGKQISAYEVVFYLALGSFFAPILLIYLPVIWICLICVRNFNFKSFLASLFSIFILYVPAFSYFYFTQNIQGFLKPYTDLFAVDWSSLPVLDYSPYQFICLGTLVFLFLLIWTDNSVNSFKDKIRIRNLSSALTSLTLFSFLCALFLNIEPQTTFYIGLAVGSLQIAHFFSLTQKKITAILFLLYFLFLVAAVFLFPVM